MDDGILKAIDYSLDDLTIIGSSGIAVRMNAVMRELNIFEDLFGNVMSGNLFVSDTQNLINILPIIGAEYLTVTLTKPSTPWKMKKVFRVYKISDRRKTSAYTEDYVLHFCSEELVLNESIKISKAYKALPISKIIADIATTHLQISPEKLPLSSITPTTENIDVVIPYWTPFYTINWLCRMARTASAPGCSFAFFEDTAGFHFAPIEALSQQKPLQAINFMPMNFEGENKENEDKTNMEMRHEAAQEYELVGAPDTLRSISTGMYSGKLVKINPFEQRINISTSNSAALFNSTQHSNKYTFMQFDKDRTRIPQTEHYDSFFRVAADNLKVETWLLQRNAYISGLHGFQLKVIVAGNMNYRVGQVVTLNLPAATSPSRDKKPMDKIYSGNYIITSIRHKVDRTKYVCILELSKDSLDTQLPVSVEGNPTMNNMRNS